MSSVQSSEIAAMSDSLQVPVVSSICPSRVNSAPATARSLSGSTGAGPVVTLIGSDWGLSPSALRARMA